MIAYPHVKLLIITKGRNRKLPQRLLNVSEIIKMSVGFLNVLVTINIHRSVELLITLRTNTTIK